MKQYLTEVKRMQQLAGVLNESLKVGGKIGDQIVLATDEENEMNIDDRVKKAIEKKGAKIDDFAILVPVNRYGEYDYDMPADQFLANIDMFVIKRRSELSNGSIKELENQQPNQKPGKEKIDSKNELVKQLLNITKMLNQSKINPSTSEIKAISDVIQTVLANVNDKEVAPQINKVNTVAQNLTKKQ